MRIKLEIPEIFIDTQGLHLGPLALQLSQEQRNTLTRFVLGGIQTATPTSPVVPTPRTCRYCALPAFRNKKLCRNHLRAWRRLAANAREAKENENRS